MRKDLNKNIRERLGKINTTNEGYEIKIVEYNGARDIIIEFQDEHKVRIPTEYKHFKDGSIKNPYHKSIYKVGYLGEGKYKVRENGKHTKAYEVWMKMLQRCYDPYFINKHLTYKDCFVCEEWHCFQNFCKWFYENYYEIEGERIELDKDILVKGNKMYSPKTCIFVPKRINTLFTKNDSSRGIYPIGVTEYYDKKWGYKKLRVRCNTLEKMIFLDYFPLDKPFQAFTCYKNFKEKYIKQIADEYKDIIPNKLYEALYKYEVEIND